MAKKATNKPAEAQALPAGYVPSLKKVYKEEIVEKLMKQFSYTTVMQVPKLVKITINEGIGEATNDKKLVEEAAEELGKIVGQKALLTTSRKDVSNFRLRKGMPIGVKVTLRDVKMYEFLERLIRISLPRIRDFNGIAEKMDGRGNYTLGLRSRSSSLRWTSTRTRESTEWKSLSSQQRRPTKRLTLSSPRSVCLSRNITTKEYGKRINEGPRGKARETGCQICRQKAGS